MDTKVIGKTATASFFDNNGIFTVVYHGSIVFKYNPISKQVILNNHGFFTATTKKRMNESMKACNIIATVEQLKGQWFVKLLKDTGASLIPFNGTICEFIA